MKPIIKTIKIAAVADKYKKLARSNSDNEQTYQELMKSLVYYPPAEYADTEKKKQRLFFVNLNRFLNSFIQANGVKNGYIICCSDHTTASVYVNHFETGIMEDLTRYLCEEFPYQPEKYKHNIWDTKDLNADAHLKAMTIGKSATVIIKDGVLVLGKYEDVIFAEYDRRDDKTFTIALFGED
ncbi:MAG: YjbQ family protein [Clostridia bacterium]|nr:YjbQ family protein [Clostridia bacterium]